MKRSLRKQRLFLLLAAGSCSLAGNHALVGNCSPLTEKRVNANLNVWCRGPGIGAAHLLLFQVRYSRARGDVSVVCGKDVASSLDAMWLRHLTLCVSGSGLLFACGLAKGMIRTGLR